MQVRQPRQRRLVQPSYSTIWGESTMPLTVLGIATSRMAAFVLLSSIESISGVSVMDIFAYVVCCILLSGGVLTIHGPMAFNFFQV